MDWNDPLFSKMRDAVAHEDLAREALGKRLDEAAKSARAGDYKHVECVLIEKVDMLLREVIERRTEVKLREKAVRSKAKRQQRKAVG